jgi:hypothetical protein
MPDTDPEKPDFGPTRGELLFRLALSLAGLALVAGAIALRGWPTGPAGFEALVITTLFFGGTAVWILHKLRGKPKS